MDALEFLMERNRLCGSYRGCVGCPFGAAECVVRDMTSEHTCKRIVAAVEQVVRCKDCRYRGLICCPVMHETIGNGLVDYSVDNGYCWCGKPKED